MRLVTFQHKGVKHFGAMTNQGVVDLNEAYLSFLEKRGVLNAKEMADSFVPTDSRSFIQGGSRSLRAAQEALADLDERLWIDLHDVVLLPPLSDPQKIICLGHNYREHVLEMGRPLPTIPVLFAKYSNVLVGPYAPIVLPRVSQAVDYEAEFAFVIGKRGRYIAQEEAMDYVAGYTIFNDVSVRDYQSQTIQWLQGKTFDGSGPIGPWLTTKDEIPDPHALDIRLLVNGEQRQQSNTANFIFRIPFLVRFLSEIMTLEPGDIISTGTPGGVGHAYQPPRYLKAGDVVRVEIERLGYIENVVVEEEERMVLADVAVRQLSTEMSEAFAEVYARLLNTPTACFQWQKEQNTWSIAQIAAHTTEFPIFFAEEALKLQQSPGCKFGRTLQDEHRLAAVGKPPEDLGVAIQNLHDTEKRVKAMLLSLKDADLGVLGTHPKYGEHDVAWIVRHFIIEHLQGHAQQMARTQADYLAQRR